MKLSNQVFLTLRDRIVNLEYPPETRLVEEELCKEFQVSRTPLREALLQLSEMNLVQSIPRYGTIVKPINFSEVRNAYEVKVHLEFLAGSLAAKRITQVQLENLLRILNDYKLAFEQRKPTADKDVNFHEIVYQATHNDVLEITLTKLTSRCIRLCRLFIPQQLKTSSNIDSLSEIYEALHSKNAELSAKLCQEHSQYFLDLIREAAF